jgi:hypothetical protein
MICDIGVAGGYSMVVSNVGAAEVGMTAVDEGEVSDENQSGVGVEPVVDPG